MGNIMGSKTIQMPLWAVIAGVAVALVIVGVIAGFLIAKSQPSDADLAVRAMAGDQEASAKIRAKNEEATVKEQLRLLKAINYTPGVYTKANPKATDGADVIASSVLLLAQGRDEELLGLLAEPEHPGGQGNPGGPGNIEALRDSVVGANKVTIYENEPLERIEDGDSFAQADGSLWSIDWKEKGELYRVGGVEVEDGEGNILAWLNPILKRTDTGWLIFALDGGSPWNR